MADHATYQSWPGPGDMPAGPDYADYPEVVYHTRRSQVPPYRRVTAEEIVAQKPYLGPSPAEEVVDCFRRGDWWLAERIFQRHGVQWIEIEAEIVRGVQP